HRGREDQQASDNRQEVGTALIAKDPEDLSKLASFEGRQGSENREQQRYPADKEEGKGLGQIRWLHLEVVARYLPMRVVADVRHVPMSRTLVIGIATVGA